MKISHRKTFFQTGFTMIELMIVVAIIATLSTIIYANVSESRAIARDNVRLSDLKQIQVAIALYKSTNGHYPREADGANGEIGEGAGLDIMIEPYLPGGIPMDPRGDGINNTSSSGGHPYGYFYDGSHACRDASGGPPDYVAIIIVRTMETRDKDTDTLCPGGIGSAGGSQGDNANHVILGPTDG